MTPIAKAAAVESCISRISKHLLSYSNMSASSSCHVVRKRSAVRDDASHSLYFYSYFCFSASCFKKNKTKQHAALSEYRPILANRPPSHSFSSIADMKLTLIPIIFIVLRIWSTVRFVLLLADSSARQNPVLVTLHVSLKFLLHPWCSM